MSIVLIRLTVLSLLIRAAAGSFKVVCSPSTVQAHLGQDVVLSCRVEPPSDLTNETLEWKCGTNDVHVYRSGGDNYDDQDLRFKNRTFLNPQNLKDGIFSLTLTNVTTKDEGTYTFCLPKYGMCFNVTLTVVLQKDNKTRNHPAAIVVVVLGVVVVGILAFRYHRRNRDRTDLQPESASIALRSPEDPAEI